jgi:hypothetical protein
MPDHYDRLRFSISPLQVREEGEGERLGSQYGGRGRVGVISGGDWDEVLMPDHYDRLSFSISPLQTSASIPEGREVGVTFGREI